jgi:hypothetical protein
LHRPCSSNAWRDTTSITYAGTERRRGTESMREGGECRPTVERLLWCCCFPPAGCSIIILLHKMDGREHQYRVLARPGRRGKSRNGNRRNSGDISSGTVPIGRWTGSRPGVERRPESTCPAVRTTNIRRPATFTDSTASGTLIRGTGSAEYLIGTCRSGGFSESTQAVPCKLLAPFV